MYALSIVIFFTLLGKLLPLYALIGLGWWAGRRLKVENGSIARILIYLLSPMVVFHSILTLDFQPSLLLLPLMFFVVSIVTALSAYWLAGFFWKDAHRNILAFTSGTGNTGYFGLPVAIALFGPESAGLLILGSLGALLYESTLGFFLVARGHHSVAESMMRVLRLPAIYACVLAVIGNLLHFSLPVPVNDIFVSVRGAYTVLGSFMIGLGLASVKSIRIDAAFTFIAFLFKFAVWPVIIFTFVALDRSWTQLLSEEAHRILLLLSIVPLAANTVAFATELKTEPAKAATAVFLSTAFALLFIPAMVAVLF